MSKPSKKERRRVKQKLKHKQSVKLRNESPYKRLAAAGRVESCKVNDSCRDQGLFSIHALLSVPNRPPTLACFLVDKWCMGLKDAWGRLDMTYERYHDFMESAESRAGFKLVDMDPDEARKLIAAGIRQANVMGFRLPPNYGKWAKAMGVGDDWASADISDFGVNGKYRFVGPISHLASRLIDGDVDKFFARPDVDFIAGLSDGGDELFDDYEDEDEEELDDEEGDEEGEGQDEGQDEEGEREFADIITHTAEGLYNVALKWCFANGEVPHPDLIDAAVLTVCASAQYQPGSDPASPPTPTLEFVLSMALPEDRERLREPVLQIGRAVRSFPDGDALADTAGFVIDDEDEQDENDDFDNLPRS